MSKKRAPARSSNVAFGFGAPSPFGAASAFSSPAASQLSYVTEPPDLSTISDGNLIVLFKNLSKKDNTTKSRALEELTVSVCADSDIDDAVLSAWIRLYPRLSIDTSPRVRNLSHSTHGTLSQRAGRKLVPHMSRIIGAWLSGQYDSDRATARAARSALTAVFPTAEKVAGVWKHYHGDILDYCSTVLTEENAETLSDERSVSVDDSQSKWSRVVAACVLTVAQLISNLPTNELSKQEASYTTLFASSRLWEFAYHPEPGPRKATYTLLRATLKSRPDLILANLPAVSTSLLVKALETPQIGSVAELLNTMVTLTTVFPDCWGVAKARKGKGAVEKLTRFIAGGSQGGGAAYWSGVQALVEVLPGAKIALTKAVVDGIHKGEQRLNLPAAWGCYLAVCFRVLEDDKDGIVLDSAVWPVYEEFLLRKDPMGRMAVPGVGAAVCAAGVAMAGVRGERVVKLVGEQVWGRGVALVKEGIPEGAADEIGARWVEMGAEVLRRTKDGNPVIDLVRRSHADVAVTCIAAIPADRGQWPEVSVLLESILARFGEAVCNAKEVAVVTVPFFTKIIPTLLDTPSLTPLLGALIAYGTYTTNTPVFQTSWTKIVPSLLHLPAPVATKAITQLLTSTTSSALRNRIPHVEELSSYISTHLQTALTTDDAASWALITASFHSSAVPAVVTTHLLDTLTAALGTSEEKLVSKICLHLHTLSLQNASVLSTFARSTHGADLLSRLLVPMESLDSKVAAAARVVSAVLESGIQGEGQAERIVGELADIIARGVRVPAEIELTLRVMAGKAQDMAMRTPQAERGALVERLVFTTEIWEGALQPFLRGLQRVSLGITGPMGGCVFLVPNETGEVEVEVEVEVVRDGMGVSSALRMGMFIVEFLKGTVDIFTTISEEARVVLLFYVSLTLELAKDNLSILGANDLWTGNSSEFEAEVLEFISDAQIFIAACIKECELAYLFVDRLLDASLAQTTTGFYAARVLTVAMSDLTENARISAEQVQAWIKGVNVRKGTDVFRTTAILTGLVEHLEASKDADRLRNELASDLTGVPPTRAAEEGLRKMIYLNAVLPRPGDDGVSPPLSSQRVIFLVKHLLGWFEDEEFSAEPNMPVIAEAAKLFTGVLQTVKELYGEHWQALCDFVVDCWHMCAEQGMREEDIPVAFSTLKLFATLRSLQDENDDIQDAWNNSTSAFYVALVSLLRNSREPDELHQPRNMCNELMARQIKSLDLKPLEGPGDIYPLLNVRSRPIQEAAWDILHRYIPSVQEQVSIEAAFSREETFQLQLPAELLSLILEPPTMKKVEGLSFERSMPLALRGYLLTWILIFDHFENASFKVKSAYIENLKEGSYITGLFDFTFDFLGHAKGRPIDASKFQIESYSPNSEESPEKDTQWLLIHLYYLSLRFTPSLAKGWWIDCKSRQKVLSVEKFTEKYLSPIIIDKELQSVRTWIQERPAPTPGEEDQEMQVKISRGAAKEVTAVYPIDDQTMEMVVRLPPTFPLRQVEVEGVKRVGLTESQFKKMQLASQAVINFQSASIIDGLTLFHKNVQLHFDGVAECAICYSILAVTPDRALPNKACQTCKHKFHSTCLLKWFKSSNSSSCPLCRTSFTFYT